MKKILAIVILAAAVSVSALAQPKAIGARFGYGAAEVDYQHYVGSPNFIQVNAGIDYFSGCGAKASAMYNYTFAQPNWTDRGEWSIYAGAGLALGYVWDHGNKAVVDIEGNKIKEDRRWGMGFMASIPVQAGLSYTFWFPLQLSVDIRPYFGIHNGPAWYYEKDRLTGFYNAGLYGFIPTLSVHYAF